MELPPTLCLYTYLILPSKSTYVHASIKRQNITEIRLKVLPKITIKLPF